MAVSASVQPLIAAFAFGIVTNSATAASVLFIRSPGPSLFLDSQRLVLTIFLISAALWSLLAFVGLTIDTSSSCQVAVAFAAAFDQIARTAFAQYLLWALNGGISLSWATVIPQIILVLRFALGAVYVGFQRAHFAPACLSSTLVLPLGASVLGLDALILSLLLFKLLQANTNGNKHQHMDADRAKVLLLGAAGAAFWTALSAPMLLGIKSLHLSLRTVLPCIGLLLLITITILAKSHLVMSHDDDDKFDSSIAGTRQYRMSDLVRDMTNRPSMQMSVARPESHVSKREQPSIISVTAFTSPDRNKALPVINGPAPGQVETGIGGLAVAGQLFPPLRSDDLVNSRNVHPPGSPKSVSYFTKTRYAKKPSHISGPVLREDSLNPLDKVATVDLATAAKQDQERRAVQTQALRSQEVGASSSAVTTDPWFTKVHSSSASSAIRTQFGPVLESAVSSSAQPSPGLDDLRRRSPRLPRHEPFRQPPTLPLQTPGTLNTANADVWDLLAVPHGEPPAAPPRSPLRQQRSFTSPAAKSIATMTPMKSEKQQSHSRKSRTTRSKDLEIVTSSCSPPKIPDVYMSKDNHIHGESKRSEAPPPYKISGQAYQLPDAPALEAFVAPPAIVETRSSPKLSLFPSSGPPRKITSPRQDSPTALDVSLATIEPDTYKGLEALPQTDGKFTTQTVMLLNDAEYRDSIITTLVDSGKSSSARKSVLNRPRPVTRTPEAAHFIQAHNRSHSCGSILTRKSSLYTKASGDPNLLPPLPPIPVSESPLFKGLGEHTRSATVGERFSSTGVGRRRLRSLTADMSTLPSARSSVMTGTTDSILDVIDLTEPNCKEAPSQKQIDTKPREYVSLRSSPVASPHRPMTPREELINMSPFAVEVAGPSIFDQPSPPTTPTRYTLSPSVSPTGPPTGTTSPYNDMWRRLGAPCPTFSNRPVSSRRQPPPNPLPLHNFGNAVVIETEPSPLESPGHALQEIEAQLQRLERSSQVSSVSQSQRMTLLAELEKEMEGQETEWQAMRHTIVRDSLSTVALSPPQAKETTSLWARVKEDRNSHLTVNTYLSTKSASPEPLRKLALPGSRISHLTLSPLQLGSPTPPDTDSDMDDEIPMMLAQAVMLARQPAVSLWRAEAPSPLVFKYTASLWSPSGDQSLVLPKIISDRQKARSAHGQIGTPPQIKSQKLWTRDKKYAPIRRGGLWKPTSPAASTTSTTTTTTTTTTTSSTAPAPMKRPTSLPARPKTAVRPLRKQKRISALPDIPESPKLHPVRHTLGLFCFPWGETSDLAYPALYQNNILGTMSSGLEPAFNMPKAASQDNDQGTFFEDCDEEDYGDNFEDMDDYDGLGSDDDEIDEEMLWEIAGMLKGEGFHLVPSGVQLPSQVGRGAPESKVVVQSPVAEVSTEQVTTLSSSKSKLWQSPSQLFQVNKKSIGLKQPTPKTWQFYVDSATVEAETRRRVEREKLSSAIGDGLWKAQPDTTRKLHAADGPSLWTSRHGSRAPGESKEMYRTPAVHSANHFESSGQASPQAWPWSGLWETKMDPPAKAHSPDGLWIPRTLPQIEKEYTLQPRSNRRPTLTQAPMEHFNNQGLWTAARSRFSGEGGWMVKMTTGSSPLA